MFRGLANASTGAKRLIGVMLVTAVGACADSPVTAPEGSLTVLDGAFVPSSALAVSTSQVTLAGGVVETHTFDDLPENCDFGVTLPNPYEGLAFQSTPYFAACVSPNETVAIIPADEGAFGAITEIMIDLPKAAVSASMDVYDLATDRDVTLNAYDAAGNLVGSATDPTDGTWVTLSVTGDIHRLGIATDQGNTYLDNLTITYAPDAPDAPDGPVDADACKKGGWSGFGFKNQGQCVRFVKTGKDSR